jgi:phospholipid transport system substrate-binding protein
MEAIMEKALAAWLLLAASTASMTSPTEVVQVAVEQVVRAVQDTDLARPGDGERQRMEVRRIAENLFDFPEMARRSLARHWTDRSSQQREEFVRLFTTILERSYFGRIENYSGERIVYTGETVDGEFATVRSKIIIGRKGEVPVEYRLHLVGSRWAVYDVLIEGVSFVSTYRAQFNRIIQTSSYDGLIEKLRSKELELTTFDQSGRKAH